MTSTENSRPNIVFLIADDHRHSAINALGDAQVDTPNLDSLIHEGTSPVSYTHLTLPTSDLV